MKNSLHSKIQLRWGVTTPSQELTAFFDNRANIANAVEIRIGFIRHDKHVRICIEESRSAFHGVQTSIVIDSPLVNVHEVAAVETRDEFNTAIFADVLSGSVCSVIEKTRFLTTSSDGNNTRIMIDRFNDHLEGLVLIEVEFESVEAAETFVLPTWLKDISEEVSGDERFKSAALAANGMPAL